MSLRTGWKVVRRSDDDDARCGRPVFAPRHARPLVAPVYTPGAWAFPQAGCGPLCVFDDAAAAARHLDIIATYDPGPWELWRCTYIPARSAFVWVRYRDVDGYPEIRGKPRWALVAGSVLAHAVRLDALERSVHP